MLQGSGYLAVEKLGKEIESSITEITEDFSNTELSKLAERMKRACEYISSNISISRDLCQCQIKASRYSLESALNSCIALEREVEFCFELDCLDECTCANMLAKLYIESKLLKSLIHSLFQTSKYKNSMICSLL
jgi:hypothetical protein